MEKKEIKRTCNYVAGGLLIYTWIGFLAVIVEMIIRAASISIRVDDVEEENRLIDSVFNTMLEKEAWSSIVGVVLGIVILAMFFYKKVSRKDIFISVNAMTPKRFFQILCVFMGTQLIFGVGGEWMEKGVNLFGYSMMQSIESASSISTTLSMFLYASLFGPIAEELVYRGFVLRSFMKLGKIPAIVLSSVLFGIMHGNIPQSVFACAVGVIFAYVTVEYSIGWSILLHIINNFVFGDLLGFLMKNLSEQTQSTLNWGIMGVFFLAGAVIVWRKREKIREYVVANRIAEKRYRYMFTAILVVVFVVIHLAMGIDMIEPLK